MYQAFLLPLLKRLGTRLVPVMLRKVAVSVQLFNFISHEDAAIFSTLEIGDGWMSMQGLQGL